MSPDWSAAPAAVPYATLGNPQSLNLYAYVGNDPVDGEDPDGHSMMWFGGQLDNAFGLEAADESEMANENQIPASSLESKNGFICYCDGDGAQQAQQPNQSTLPQDPSGLGPDWKEVTPQGGKNPKIPRRFRGPKGTELEFDPADPNKSPKTWGGRDHWHEVDPSTGKRKDGHLAPGSSIPGPDGNQAPAKRSMMDRMKSITPGPILKFGTAGVVVYILIDEGSRLYLPRNLVPVP